VKESIVVAMSKRLSHGSALAEIVASDEEDEIVTPLERRKSNGRRRSSFGGGLSSSRSPKKSEAEQARIAEMYATVIKMSSENVSNVFHSNEIMAYSYKYISTRK
jgi:hypothetical protein